MKRKALLIIGISALLALVGCTQTGSNNSSSTQDPTPKPVETTFTVSFKNSNKDSSISLSSLADMYEDGSQYVNYAYVENIYKGSKGLKFSSSSKSGKLTLTLNESIAIKSISAKIFVYGSDVPNFSINDKYTSIKSDGDYLYELSGEETDTINIVCNSAKRFYLKSLTIKSEAVTPVSPTAISITPSIELHTGEQTTLNVTYTPSNANTNKEVSWKSSNTNVATVKDGVVEVKSTATAGQSATITASLKNLSSVKATCKVTVTEKQLDAWTVMIYMCGSDLESDSSQGGLATSDIAEILSVKNQPDDVNILIETGGAKSWKSTYGISSSKLGRWEVRNNSLKKVQELTYASMGLQSTFRSFLDWGLGSYPAEKTAVIFWNHGGAMDGVCFDEKKNDDSLLNSEVDAALTSVLGSQKLEWVGYDACLMQVQDIAQFNSKHFNYMVAAQESETGEGWDYDTWVDDLYSKKPTETILKAICDGFISSVDELYNNYGSGYSAADNDQTLSYLDLSHMDEYKTAFDSLTTKVKSVGISTLRTLMKNVKNYADTWCDSSDYSTYTSQYGYPTSWFTSVTEDGQKYYCLHGYYLYGTFDVTDMLNKMKSSGSYSSCTTEINACLTALSKLIAYSKIGQAAGNSHGLCVVVSMDSSSFVPQSYVAGETDFVTWRSFVTA